MNQNLNISYLKIKNKIKNNFFLFKNFKEKLKKYNLKEYELVNLAKIKKPENYYGFGWDKINLNFSEEYIKNEPENYFNDLINEYLYKMKLRKEFLIKNYDIEMLYELFIVILKILEENTDNKKFKTLIENFLKECEEEKYFKEISKNIYNELINLKENNPKLFKYYQFLLDKFITKTYSYPVLLKDIEEWKKIINNIKNLDKKSIEKYFFNLWI